jgi:hypothetical protein
MSGLFARPDVAAGQDGFHESAELLIAAGLLGLRLATTVIPL